MDPAADSMREQLRLVKDSAALFLPADSGTKRARTLRFIEPGFDRALWMQMCELGWAGLRVPEDRGGIGLGIAELCAIAQQLGAALSPEPLIAVAVTAPLLPESDLQAVISGQRIVLPAWMEQPHDLAGHDRVRFDRERGRVTGVKRLVEAASGADAFAVSTRDGLVLVERSSPGVVVRSMGMHDGTFVGEITFDSAPARALPGSLEDVLEEAALANAAYLLGLMERAFEITMDHLRTRTQFGKPIGSFQVLRHRSVDLKLQIELTRAVVDEAAAALDLGLGTREDRYELVSRAKSRAADACMLVARETVHFHGAMGTTDECDIGLYARKALTAHNAWGSAAAHRKRFSSLQIARYR